MSLILEALRRSEAERRRGSPPSLLGEGTPPRVHRPSPWPIALGGLAAGLLIAGAAMWWFDRERPPVPASTEAPAMPQAHRTDAAAPAPAATTAGSTDTGAPPPPTANSAAAAAFIPGVDEPAAAAPPTTSAETDPALGPRPGDLPLGTLIGAQREALPPLRVSMHVYAEDPARRFAIVDGQRLREGDTFASGLQVLAIQRDGLRLAWQGAVLWVPR